MANEEVVHPSPEVIAEWLRAQGPGGRPLLHHLLGCTACAETAAALLAEAERAQAERNLERDRTAEAYRGLWERLDDRFAADEEEIRQHRLAAEPLVAELLGRPASERAGFLAAERRLQTWAVAERLLELAAEEPASGPARALALAELAADIANRLDPAEHSPGLLRELNAEAAMRLGEARRLVGRLEEADADLRRAQEIAGVEPWGARGELCRLLARLRQDQERTDEALALFGRAADLLEDGGRTAEAIEARAEEGTLDLALWRVEEAAAAFDTAAALCLGPGAGDPVIAIEEAAWSLARQGRSAAAGQLIEQARQHLGPILEPEAERELAGVEARWRARWSPAREEAALEELP